MEKIICTNSSGGSGGGSSSSSNIQEEVRKGPWTMEEDLILINYIANHGEGNWNTLAKSAGLKRTGKSCRLRWLNYLRPDVRRGNITPEEQLLIMDLHSKWGNRWSKIARQLPGRTDNEIKNFWRTRMQKKPTQGEHFDNQYEPLNQMVMDDAAGTSSFNGIDEYSNGTQDNYPMNPNVGGVDAFGSNAPDVTADNFWSVEDYWFVQPPNGADH